MSLWRSQSEDLPIEFFKSTGIYHNYEGDQSPSSPSSGSNPSTSNSAAICA